MEGSAAVGRARGAYDTLASGCPGVDGSPALPLRGTLAGTARCRGLAIDTGTKRPCPALAVAAAGRARLSNGPLETDPSRGIRLARHKLDRFGPVAPSA